MIVCSSFADMLYVDGKIPEENGGLISGYSVPNVVFFPLFREIVINKITNCCRRSSGVSYKYTKVIQ